MKIVVNPSDSVELREFFEFNLIPYQAISLWDVETELYSFISIPDDDISLVVIDYEVFLDIIHNQNSYIELLKFVSCGNKIWVWSDYDSAMFINRKINDLIKLDSEISSGVTLWHDVQWLPNNPLDFHNIKVVEVPYTLFIRPSRIFKSTIKKSLKSKDFMITTITKNPVRQYLIENIYQKNLDKFGHVISSPKKNYDNWVGNRPLHHRWCDGFPSMNLYNDSWLEIVPETLADNAHFVTEKTIKPMLTETPFLISSTCGYLDHLKKLGFKTFDTLIDESYDHIEDPIQRVDRLLDVVEDICDNGAKSFYEASRDILEHNRLHVGTIYSSRQFENDRIIWNEIESCMENAPKIGD